jgi:hypothetical protein
MFFLVIKGKKRIKPVKILANMTVESSKPAVNETNLLPAWNLCRSGLPLLIRAAKGTHAPLRMPPAARAR